MQNDALENWLAGFTEQAELAGVKTAEEVAELVKLSQRLTLAAKHPELYAQGVREVQDLHKAAAGRWGTAARLGSQALRALFARNPGRLKPIAAPAAAGAAGAAPAAAAAAGAAPAAAGAAPAAARSGSMALPVLGGAALAYGAGKGYEELGGMSMNREARRAKAFRDFIQQQRDLLGLGPANPQREPYGYHSRYDRDPFAYMGRSRSNTGE